MKSSLVDLEKRLGYAFTNKGLLKQALTSKTASSSPAQNNERLEFLGDRVLGLVLADLLQTFLPSADVGQLSDAFIKYARNDAKLSSLGEEYKLYQYTGKSGTKGLADAMEALIGAVFLDSKRDYSLAKAFIAKHWAIEFGLPTREILPFYIIKQYDDEQLVEGFLRLGLDPNSVLSLEGEYKQEYTTIMQEEFKSLMRSAISDTFEVALGDIYDFENDSPPMLEDMYTFMGARANEAARGKAVKTLESKFKVPARELSSLMSKSLVHVACSYQRRSIVDILVRYGAVIDKRCTSNTLAELQSELESEIERSDQDYEYKVRDEVEQKHSSAKEFATRDLTGDEQNYWDLYIERTKTIDERIEKEVAEEVIKLKILDLRKLTEHIKFVLYIFKLENIEVEQKKLFHFMQFVEQLLVKEGTAEKLTLSPELMEVLQELQATLVLVLKQEKSSSLAAASSTTTKQVKDKQSQAVKSIGAVEEIDESRWYGTDDITSYVDLMIEKELGGYKERPERSKYLLTARARQGELIAVSCAIDTAGTIPIDSFLDKNKQERNNLADALERLLPHLGALGSTSSGMLQVKLVGMLPNKDKDFLGVVAHELQSVTFNPDQIRQRIEDLDRQDSRSDIFDELLPELLKFGEPASAKILFPYNITNIHWLVGEIKISRNGNQYKVCVCAHDPYDCGMMSQGNFETLKATIVKRITEEHKKLAKEQPSIECHNEPSIYGRRQREGDVVSCGVIAAEELIKLIKGEPLDVTAPYEEGAVSLRRKHVAKFEEHLSLEDGRRVSFVERNKLKLGLPVNLGLRQEYISQVMPLVNSITNLDLKKRITDALANRQGLSMRDGSFIVSVKTALEQMPVLLRSNGVILAEQDIFAVNKIHKLLFGSITQGKQSTISSTMQDLWVLSISKLNTDRSQKF